TQGSRCAENACQSPKIATSAPAIGVHKPAASNKPSTAAPACARTIPKAVPVRGIASSSMISEIPHTRRMIRRPTPGQPRAKLEYNRRTIFLSLMLRDCQWRAKAPIGSQDYSFEYLEFDDSSF